MERHEFKEVPYGRFLFYGVSGSGKTGLVGTFDQDPRSARTLICSAAGNPVRIMYQKPEPIVIDITSLDDLSTVYNFLRQGQKPDAEFRKDMSIDPDVVFKSVAIDTASEVQRLVNNEIMGMAGRMDIIHTGKMGRDEWQTSLTRMINLFSLFYNLPMHVIVTLQEKTDVDDATGAVFHRPFLQGQSKELAPGYAEIIGRLVRRRRPEKVGDEPKVTPQPEIVGEATTIAVLYLDSAGAFLAKNQVCQALGKGVKDPTAKFIFDTMEASMSTTKEIRNDGSQ